MKGAPYWKQRWLGSSQEKKETDVDRACLPKRGEKENPKFLSKKKKKREKMFSI